jgi:hypothetical protein
MSLASRQVTCPACGNPFQPGDMISIEAIIEADQPTHYIAVHGTETTFVHHDKDSHDQA